MDIMPLTQAVAFKGEPSATAQLTQQPPGTESTQTGKAVQALDKAATNVTQDEAQEREALSTDQLSKMAEQMDEFVGSFTHELKFRVDEDSGRNVVTVVDKKSGDTIRQIPTEELLEVVARLAEASGGLIDVKA